MHRGIAYRIVPLLLDRGIVEKCPRNIYLRTNYPSEKECFKLGSDFVLEKMGLWWFRDTLRFLEEQHRMERYYARD